MADRAPQAGLQAGGVAIVVVVDHLAEDGPRDALDAVRRRREKRLRTTRARSAFHGRA